MQDYKPECIKEILKTYRAIREIKRIDPIIDKINSIRCRHDETRFLECSGFLERDVWLAIRKDRHEFINRLIDCRSHLAKKLWSLRFAIRNNRRFAKAEEKRMAYNQFSYSI